MLGYNRRVENGHLNMNCVGKVKSANSCSIHASKEKTTKNIHTLLMKFLVTLCIELQVALASVNGDQ